MKKKQKQKLIQQFRPNYQQVRGQLFREIEKKSLQDFGLPIEIIIDPKKQDDMTIVFTDRQGQLKKAAIPMDDNFVAVVKRIQKQEKGLLDRFSTNLTNGIAEYLTTMTAATPVSGGSQTATTKPSSETTKDSDTVAPVTETTEAPAATTTMEDADVAVSGDTETSAHLSYHEFSQKITAFAKFFVEEGKAAILVKEKTAKEDRLLATISTEESHAFTIEKALDRKYKLKTEVIPVIEAFAKTPLAIR